jgi:ectoine hydroxylase-related dioxygenase (phytanoyl-CoA dioxygenase family)
MVVPHGRSTRSLDEMSALIQHLESDGFAVVPGVIDDTMCDRLASVLDARPRSGPGSRRLLSEGWCADLAECLKIHPTLSAVLPATAVATQCSLFDKTPEANWLVPLHQDLSIPVASRVEATDCRGWSEKEGDLYVQPPPSILEALVAVRIHVDSSPDESGSLRVVPGSHSAGRLNPGAAESLRRARGEVVVPVPRGGALVLKPLLLHASSKAARPRTRRVLHFLFGPALLPLGLAWQHSI